MSATRVAVNGYGVIGKRVADAVVLQHDMELVGVADAAADYRVALARSRDLPLFGSTPEAVIAMGEAGLAPAGTLEDLLGRADIIVDATPKHVGAANKARYDAHGLRSVFQGGEPHELTGLSFVAQANYAAAHDARAARVVSCNTTGLVRVLGGLHDHGLLESARAVLLRRGTDPWESHRGGMINTVLPEAKVPSHQGPDARTVLPDLNLVTVAAAGPFNLAHVHFAFITAPRPTDRDEVLAALTATPRVALVQVAAGVEAPNAIIEIARDLGRPRADVWEVAIWADTVAVDGREVVLTYMVHNESIVVPENIDAIRALAGNEPNPSTSIAATDASLGVRTTLP